MFNDLLVPSNQGKITLPQSKNLPPPEKPAVIKLVLGPNPHIEVRRRTYRIYRNPSPASVKRITRLADWLSIADGWLVYPNFDGWLVIEREVAK